MPGQPASHRMTTLPNSLAAWGTADFRPVLKAELAALDADRLGLQAALTASSHALDHGHEAVLLAATENADSLAVKVGIFYRGVIAGCNCADDPSPPDELTEYCELAITIARPDGRAHIQLLPSP